MDQLESLLETGLNMAIAYLPKVLLAALVLWLGFKIVGRLTKGLTQAMRKAGISDNLLPFLSSLASVSLKVLIVFSAISLVGVEITAFMAVLAAAGFAVGLALQGSLANFAAGIIILLFRPYKVGDWIDVDDKFGQVEEIQIFNTIMVTPGAKTLIIPNGQVVDNIVTNYSKRGHIRMELNVTMPYSESYPKVRDIIMKELQAIHKVLDTPAPEVGIEAYDSHNIVIAVRPYVIPDDFWEVTFEVYQRIKRAFYENKIHVAYSEGVEMGNIGD
ncbi:MAG: mechanosensitive ion channel [Bacteroidetes bacterium]|jgi:small conductance mechanosensitive channel|nr:mechanosensitive ion channel [Bacteroidota bacterium]